LTKEALTLQYGALAKPVGGGGRVMQFGIAVVTVTLCFVGVSAFDAAFPYTYHPRLPLFKGAATVHVHLEAVQTEFGTLWSLPAPQTTSY
jgi:hypothetical protein